MHNKAYWTTTHIDINKQVSLASRKAELSVKYLNMSESTYLENRNTSISEYVNLKNDGKLTKM